MTKFQIIDSQNYFSSKKYRVIGMTVLITLFILLRISVSNEDLENYLGPYLYNLILGPLTIILILIGLFMVISYWYSRKTKKNGYIMFEEKSIKINTKPHQEVIEYKNIKLLKISHNSYVGQDYESSPINNFIGDNWININTQEEEFKYEFKVDSHYKTKQLVNLISFLKSKDILVEYEQK